MIGKRAKRLGAGHPIVLGFLVFFARLLQLVPVLAEEFHRMLCAIRAVAAAHVIDRA